MKYPRLIVVLCWVLCSNLLGQSSAFLGQTVSVDYTEILLADAIEDLGRRYHILFSYSSNQLPANQRVTLYLREAPLAEALDLLLAETKLVYALIGNQVVLKADPNKPERGFGQLSSRESLPPLDRSRRELKNPVVSETAGRRPSKEEYPPDRSLTDLFGPPETIQPGEAVRAKEVSSLEKREFRGGRDVTLLFLDSMNVGKEPDVSVAQVSILPFLGTNFTRSAQTTNHFSFNLFMGTNGGVDGLEVGGLFNTITGDVRGTQLAGLGNVVAGNVKGSQLAGLFNVNGGHTAGLQAAGLFNYTTRAQAAQLAGLFNVGGSEYGGLQAAGLFNLTTGREGRSSQLAGLMNATGHAKMQVAGLINVAGTVEAVQVAGLVNIAGEVKGVQIGLLNVADTVGGASIGLLSLVNRGYNRIEIAAGDALWANLGLKLGTRRFYNIFHGGLRWYDASVAGDEELTWGVGYGFGTAARLSPRTLLNLELLAIHVNERSRWTHELNLLNQFRMTLDFRLGRTLSLFAGGTFNVMVSRLLDPDTGEIGSGIAPYHWSNYTTNGTNVQTWAGFNAGLRF